MPQVLAEKNATHQKPFRCSAELEAKINRAKGALMLKTGERISDNKFLIELIELGLESINQKLRIKKD